MQATWCRLFCKLSCSHHQIWKYESKKGKMVNAEKTFKQVHDSSQSHYQTSFMLKTELSKVMRLPRKSSSKVLICTFFSSLYVCFLNFKPGASKLWRLKWYLTIWKALSLPKIEATVVTVKCWDGQLNCKWLQSFSSTDNSPHAATNLHPVHPEGRSKAWKKNTCARNRKNVINAFKWASTNIEPNVETEKEFRSNFI